MEKDTERVLTEDERKAKEERAKERRERRLRRCEEALRIGGILRPADVALVVGLDRVTLYRRAKSGTFPAPRLLGERSVPGSPIGWDAATIKDWLASRPSTVKAAAA